MVFRGTCKLSNFLIKKKKNFFIIVNCLGKAILTIKVPRTKIDEFANSIYPDEVAQNEPPHLDLHCLLYSLGILNMI